MTSDLPLFACAAATRPALTRRPDIDAAFWSFRDENPAVETWLVREIRDWLAQGYRRLSFRMFWEMCRAAQLRQRRPDEKWALDNDLQAPWVEYLSRTYPEMRGVFERRMRRGDA